MNRGCGPISAACWVGSGWKQRRAFACRHPVEMLPRNGCPNLRHILPAPAHVSASDGARNVLARCDRAFRVSPRRRIGMPAAPTRQRGHRGLPACSRARARKPALQGRATSPLPLAPEPGHRFFSDPSLRLQARYPRPPCFSPQNHSHRQTCKHTARVTAITDCRLDRRRHCRRRRGLSRATWMVPLLADVID